MTGWPKKPFRKLVIHMKRSRMNLLHIISNYFKSPPFQKSELKLETSLRLTTALLNNGSKCAYLKFIVFDGFVFCHWSTSVKYIFIHLLHLSRNDGFILCTMFSNLFTVAQWHLVVPGGICWIEENQEVAMSDSNLDCNSTDSSS